MVPVSIIDSFNTLYDSKIKQIVFEKRNILWSTCFDWCPPPPSCCWNNDPPSWYWTSSLVPVVMLLDTVSHCFVSHMFQSRCLWVPGKNPLTLTGPKISDIFFLSSSLMSNARNWCKLTDGEQINTYHKKQSLRILTKLFEVAQKMQAGSPMKTISRSVFPLSLTIWAGTAPPSKAVRILLTVYSSSTRFFYLILRPLSFANLWQSKKISSFFAGGWSPTERRRTSKQPTSLCHWWKYN